MNTKETPTDLMGVICNRTMHYAAELASKSPQTDCARLTAILKEQVKAGYHGLMAEMREADLAFFGSEPKRSSNGAERTRRSETIDLVDVYRFAMRCRVGRGQLEKARERKAKKAERLARLRQERASGEKTFRHANKRGRFNKREQMQTQQLTQVQFEDADFELAEKVAKRLGYTQTAYTSTSALWGLFCLPDHAKHKHGCIIKTQELGLLFVSNLENLQLDDLAEQEFKQERKAVQS